MDNANQIKSKRQLLDLKDLEDFIYNKIDDFEHGRLEKGKKKYKGLKSISDLSERKRGRYNCGERQARSVLW